MVEFCMDFLNARYFVFAILVSFLVSFGMGGFNAARIAHELEHADVNTHKASFEHHASGDVLYVEDTENEQLSDADHKLLHAAGLVQPATLSTFDWQPPFAPSVGDFVPISAVIAHATREPPFRPPRLILA